MSVFLAVYLSTFMNYSLYQQVETDCLNHLLSVIAVISLHHVETHQIRL
jgi:hypothetical protein